MNERLSRYFPSDVETKVVLAEERIPEIERIGEFLPDEVLWEMFSSNPKSTGGVIIFPYLRVDGRIIEMNDWMTISSDNPERLYCIMRACLPAFKVLLWVEVGFEGMGGFARKADLRNWTSFGGHWQEREEKAATILEEGKGYYEESFRKFALFREKNKGIIGDNDLFSRYGVEFLLDSFLTSE